jgi:hypothetical protein
MRRRSKDGRRISFGDGVQNAITLFASVLIGGLLLMPRLSGAKLWRATITPLASIIGSGFLVLGPILDSSYGVWAPAVMAGLCLTAWLFGGSIRFSIAARDSRTTAPGRDEVVLETASSWALAFAYIISVSYYLNLFGAFSVSLTSAQDGVWPKLVTSAMLIVIGVVGWTRGFNALERLEQISVSIKLAIIAGLLVGLAGYFVNRLPTVSVAAPHLHGWAAVAVAFGLIVTVQGFETSRYLGDDYDAPTRIRSMRWAQGISTAIYMVYILLLTFALPPTADKLTETAIVDMMAIVAPVLPLLLVGAALSAQFSAALADTGGSGGLITELTGGRISARQGYVALVLAGLALTWSANVFEIIAYASRAFALYYALQAAMAAVFARHDPKTRWRVIPYLALSAMGFAIVVFGVSVE